MRSFVKNEAAATSATPTATIDAPPPAATQPATTTVVVRSRGAYIDGEVNQSDIKTPFLSCVQSVGPKSQLFRPGTLVLGETAISQEPAVGAPSGKVRLVFCRASKTFVENLPYNPAPGAPRPRIFHKLSDVQAAGLTTEWHGNTAPGAMPKTTCLALVRQPAALDDGQFNIIDGDKTYAPAMVSFQKTSYSAAKTLWTDLSLSLKGDPTTTFYDLHWVREQRGQNWVWVAKIARVRDEKPTDSLIATARKIGGGNVSLDDSGEE